MSDNTDNRPPTANTTNGTNDANDTNRTNGTRTNNTNQTNEVLTAQNIGFDIHALANRMVKDGWYGETMRDPATVMDYILLAASNPNIANELPETGLRFWRAAKFRYEADRARKMFGQPPREVTTRDPAL